MKDLVSIPTLRHLSFWVCPNEQYVNIKEVWYFMQKDTKSYHINKKKNKRFAIKKPEKLNWPSGALKMLRLQVQILSWAKKTYMC